MHAANNAEFDINCFCTILTKIEVWQQISIHLLNIKFHENVCNFSHVLTHTQQDMVNMPAGRQWRQRSTYSTCLYHW